jgi:hypothetical protein
VKVHYREHEHAVTTNDRYGYYRQIEYNSVRCGQVVLETRMPPHKPQDSKKFLWPLTLYLKVVVHNHEDLTRITDMLLESVDSMRGEYGEFEATSPSSWRLPGDWRHIAMYRGR